MSEQDIYYECSGWYSLKDLPGEEWRDVDRYEGYYQVSSYGRVKGLDRWVPGGQCNIFVTGKIIAQRMRSNYLAVNLRKNGNDWTVPVHRLVAYAFLGVPYEGYDQVNHKDCNKLNNKADNLEWIDCAGNIQHAAIHGLLLVGEASPSSVLTEEVVNAIRADSKVMSYEDISVKYDVNISTIRDVVSGRTWKHLESAKTTALRENARFVDFNGKSLHGDLTVDKVKEIKRRGKFAPYSELAKIYGLCRSEVQQILEGKSWKFVEVDKDPDVVEYVQAGVNINTVVLTEEQVKEIYLRGRYKRTKDIAADYNLSTSPINHILTKRNWVRLTDKIDAQKMYQIPGTIYEIDLLELGRATQIIDWEVLKQIITSLIAGDTLVHIMECYELSGDIMQKILDFKVTDANFYQIKCGYPDGLKINLTELSEKTGVSKDALKQFIDADREGFTIEELSLLYKLSVDIVMQVLTFPIEPGLVAEGQVKDLRPK